MLTNFLNDYDNMISYKNITAISSNHWMQLYKYLVLLGIQQKKNCRDFQSQIIQAPSF
jgi:hypothetical protein